MKRRMRSLCGLALLLGLLLLSGCAGKAPETGNRLQVLAAAFPEYDFVRAVAGDLAEITLLLPPGAEAHSYEPTPRISPALAPAGSLSTAAERATYGWTGSWTARAGRGRPSSP